MDSKPSAAPIPRPITPELAEEVNRQIRQAYRLLHIDHPVGCVQWVPISNVRANDYNPNAVAHHELNLLYTSIKEDGYTQPVVCIEDDQKPGHYVIVDGFHRYTIARRFPDIADSTGGLLPVVVIDKPLADRMASTIRHNRARGKHSVGGMGNLVFQMLMQGVSDSEICNKIGLEAEELARLKHVTGYSKLYADRPSYSRMVWTKPQAEARREYHLAHPDETLEQI